MKGLALSSATRALFNLPLLRPRGKREWLRTGVTATGTLALLAALAQAPAPPPVLFALGFLVAISELTAFDRPGGSGVVSFTFVGIVLAQVLAGGPLAVLIAGASVVLGDGVRRRLQWYVVWERAALLALMVAGGAAAVAAAQTAGLINLLPPSLMVVWAIIFAVWLGAEARRTSPSFTRLFQGGVCLAFILAVSLAPGPVALALQTDFPVTGTPLGTFLLFAAGFMLVDTALTSAGQHAGYGVPGLSVWRTQLPPAFFLYNTQALAAAALLWVETHLGLFPAAIAVGFAAASFAMYAERVRRRAMLLRILQALTAALDARDTETGQHSDRVAWYAVALTRAAGLGTKRERSVEIAAVLHDIGKIGVPDAILHKPGPLTPEEFAVMKEHVRIGVDILWNVPEFRSVAAVVRQDHERWDGTGYPHGLKDTAIALEARIVAVADVYDALTSERPYKEAFSPEKALGILRDSAGTHLDPRLVGLMEQLYATGELAGDLAFGYCLTH